MKTLWRTAPAHPFYDTIGTAHGTISAASIWEAQYTTNSYPFNYGYDEVLGTDATVIEGNARWAATADQEIFDVYSKCVLEYALSGVSLSDFTNFYIVSGDHGSPGLRYDSADHKFKGRVPYNTMTTSAEVPESLRNHKNPVIRFEFYLNGITTSVAQLKIDIYINNTLVHQWTSINHSQWYPETGLANRFKIKNLVNTANDTSPRLLGKLWSMTMTTTVYADSDRLGTGTPIQVNTFSSDDLDIGSKGWLFPSWTAMDFVSTTDNNVLHQAMSEYRIPFKQDMTPIDHGLDPSLYTRRPFNFFGGGNFPHDTVPYQSGPFIMDATHKDYSYGTLAAGVMQWVQLNP